MSMNKPTILVVDDSSQNIDVLAGILKDEFRVRAATTGPKALSMAVDDMRPDLILLDVMMPDMDGLEVCRRLKADMRTRSIPVIFVTAMEQDEDEAAGFEVGCVDYVTKPVSATLVRARIRTHLALTFQNVELERQVKVRTAELEQTQMAVIRCLGKASEFKDDHTGMHVIRMSHYARVLGRAVGMSEADADLLMRAAPMHDVGKIGVPDSILKKPGKLTPDEWSIMQKHVDYGAQIIGDHHSELLKLAKTIALTHHEKWDGSGYPTGLRGEDIPLCGRIIALADVFDALTSERPYKPAWSAHEALSYIRGSSGSHFDPALVERLERVLDQFEVVRLQYGDESGAALAA